MWIPTYNNEPYVQCPYLPQVGTQWFIVLLTLLVHACNFPLKKQQQKTEVEADRPVK